MVRRAYRQRRLIEVLRPYADKLWDRTLRRIDALLDDEGLVDRFVAYLISDRAPLGSRASIVGRGRAERTLKSNDMITSSCLRVARR
jgi:hypothetical protein